MHFGSTLSSCHYSAHFLHSCYRFEGSLDEVSDSMGVLNSEVHCLHVIVTCVCAFLLQWCLCVTVILAFLWSHTWWNHIPLSQTMFSYVILWTMEMASHWCEKHHNSKESTVSMSEWKCPCFPSPYPANIHTRHGAQSCMSRYPSSPLETHFQNNVCITAKRGVCAPQSRPDGAFLTLQSKYWG